MSIDALFYRVVCVVRVVRVGISWVMYVPVDGEVGAGVLGAGVLGARVLGDSIVGTVGRCTCGGPG
jgi:hypothetical protein